MNIPVGGILFGAPPQHLQSSLFLVSSSGGKICTHDTEEATCTLGYGMCGIKWENTHIQSHCTARGSKNVYSRNMLNRMSMDGDM